MKNIWQTIKDKIYLDKSSWIIFVLAIIGNLFLWYIWFFKIHFSRTPMFFSFAVLITNVFLSFLFSKKDILIAYFLLGTALLVQVFTLILLKFSFVQI